MQPEVFAPAMHALLKLPCELLRLTKKDVVACRLGALVPTFLQLLHNADVMPLAPADEGLIPVTQPKATLSSASHVLGPLWSLCLCSILPANGACSVIATARDAGQHLSALKSPSKNCFCQEADSCNNFAARTSHHVW